MEKPENGRWRVDGYLKILLRITKYAGLAPIRFESTHLGTFVRLSKAQYYYGLFVVTLMNLLSFLSIHCLAPIKGYREGVIVFLSFLLWNHSLAVLAILFTAIHALKRTESFLDCLIKIRKIHIIDANDVSAPKYLVLTVLFCNILVITTTVWYKDNIYGLLFSACKTVIFSQLMLLELQFSYIAQLINTRFQDVNRRLKETVRLMQQEDNTVPYRRLQMAHKIHQINNSFTSTNKVAKELNDTENSLLFLHIVAFIMQFIASATILLETSYLKQATVSSQLSRHLYYSSWILYEIVKGLVIIEPSHEHQEQLKRTRILVAEIMTHVTSESDLILDAITNFYKHLLLNNFSYSTMGVFKLERSLISKIVGVVIAVIILFI